MCVHEFTLLMYQSMHFFVKVALSKCVHVRVWACWPVSPRVFTPSIHLWFEQQQGCVQACLCACLRNAEQPLPPTLTQKKKKKRKSHSQEATLKYQVLIWQIQATGVFTFQRLRREKDQMPPWAAQQRPYRDHSHRHGWQTCVCVWGVWVAGGAEAYKKHWAKSLNTLWWLAAGRHDTMQQCWKWATLVKFVCLNGPHFLSPQTAYLPTDTRAHGKCFPVITRSPSYWPFQNSIAPSLCWHTGCKQLKYFLIG